MNHNTPSTDQQCLPRSPGAFSHRVTVETHVQSARRWCRLHEHLVHPPAGRVAPLGVLSPAGSRQPHNQHWKAPSRGTERLT